MCGAHPAVFGDHSPAVPSVPCCAEYQTRGPGMRSIHWAVFLAPLPTFHFIFGFFWGHTNGAQDLLLALCSGITPGTAQGPYVVPGFQYKMCRGKCLTCWTVSPALASSWWCVCHACLTCFRISLFTGSSCFLSTHPIATKVPREQNFVLFTATKSPDPSPARACGSSLFWGDGEIGVS